MICLKRKKCEKIINHLIQEYHSYHRKETKNQIGKVDIDHISRGFANSTAVVSRKLAVEYDYIDKLVDFLLQSLEKDFPKIDLKSCEEFIVRAVEVEYKKLPPTANTWLMQACMAQQGTIEQCENGILKRLEETKKNIENRCALSTEKRTQRKWWKDPKWIIGTIIAIIGAIVGIKQCSNSSVSKNTNMESRTSGDSSPIIIAQGPNSPINYSQFGQDIRKPSLHLYFSASNSKATKIGITGDYGKRIYEVPMKLTLTNSAERSADEIKLVFLEPHNIYVISEDPKSEMSIEKHGELAKNKTTIPIGTIHPTRIGVTSTCEAKLRWVCIDMMDITSPIHPFSFNRVTNQIKEFRIDGEIAARDMPPVQIDLRIFIGTRKAFKAAKYEGEVFGISDDGELIETSL